ncbi:hypothetical protein ACFXDE_30950 [Kitasatospora sp. NPDC059408]|uniref:hypothetical protein n=1 Tax=Kitasatospora sp. NPDC059408 TaxID=3346823 RepID=UPI00367DB81E
MQIAVSAFGGGVVGSLTSTAIASGREGRIARARVRELLFNCENLRWGDSDYREFQRALSELESAALIAQLHPAGITRYAYIAQVARATNLRIQDNFPDHPRALPSDLHMLVNHTVQLVTWPLWRRWYGRRSWKLAAWKIDDPTVRLRKEHPEWAWDYPTMKPLRLQKEPGVLPCLVRLCPPLYRRLVARNSMKRQARIMQSEGLS